ncbi:hypothetical protein BX600DRAFT_260634 [Xylariales sp. PMI_506]|nr:hypothetical protein BX600DRAFT_260634 [Xylariales sp. PMI_506]
MRFLVCSFHITCETGLSNKHESTGFVVRGAGIGPPQVTSHYVERSRTPSLPGPDRSRPVLISLLQRFPDSSAYLGADHHAVARHPVPVLPSVPSPILFCTLQVRAPFVDLLDTVPDGYVLYLSRCWQPKPRHLLSGQRNQKTPIWYLAFDDYRINLRTC